MSVRATAEVRQLHRRLRPSVGAWRNYAVLGAFVALVLTLSLSSDAFLARRNLSNVLDQASLTGIVACAATLVIVAGGFDLAVGAIFAVAGIVAAKVASTAGVPLGLLAGAASGLGLGVLNALLVTVGRVNSFIATFASSIMIRGVALVATGGFLVSVSDAHFQRFGTWTLLGLTTGVWAFFAAAVSAGFLLRATTFGRCLYAVGGNAEVARLSGINVALVRSSTFALSGFAAGVAGVIAATRVGQAQATVGDTLPLDAIAAVAIGGTSIRGGEGAVWRTVVGVLILELLDNGFALLDVNPSYQGLLHGGVIVVAVGADALARRRR